MIDMERDEFFDALDRNEKTNYRPQKVRIMRWDESRNPMIIVRRMGVLFELWKKEDGYMWTVNGLHDAWEKTYDTLDEAQRELIRRLRK